MTRIRKVGLESWGVYLPSHFHSSEYISQETGIAKAVLEEKFGIRQKTVPGPEDHTVAMAAKASMQAMQRINITAEDLDLIIWAGEVYAEHPMMTYGIKLQHLLGNPSKPWAFDVNQRCGTFLIGLQIAKSFMQTDSSYKRILIASGYRNSDLIDYRNERARFMTSLAASGVAAVVKADLDVNEILGISVITDGQFADDVYVPAGGTIEPISVDALKNRRNYLDVPDPQGLKERLDQKSMENFVKVIDNALIKSKMTCADIDFLALLHMKRTAFNYVAQALGVDPVSQSIYLEDLGHNGQNDGIIAIDMGIKQQKIKNDSVVVIAAAGIGWAWNAGVIKWGS